ncbi:MAG: hypothetical protein Q4A42_07285 [Tissierellia bacterium]|nr:hypothetical protein [Tissierellia bacterium]
MSLLDKYHITPKQELMEQLNKLKELVDKKETITVLEMFHNIKNRALLYSFCSFIYYFIFNYFISLFSINFLESFINGVLVFLVFFFLFSLLFMMLANYKRDTLNKPDLISHFNQNDELIIKIIECNSIKDEFLIKKFRKNYLKLYQAYIYWKENINF